MSLTRQDWLDLAEMHKRAQVAAGGTGYVDCATECQRKAHELVKACSSTADCSSEARDWQNEIEAGDKVVVGIADPPCIVVTVAAPYIWVRHPLAGESETCWAGRAKLDAKRPDRPGDGFVHLDHPEWGIGGWRAGPAGAYCYFGAVGDVEFDRSRLRRVFAVEG